jgi:hypothetical protein
MGIDWMKIDELSESIPPAYSEFIARDVVLNYRPKRKANKPKARKRRKAK